MTIRSRLALLLAGLLAVFVLAEAMLHRAQRAEAEQMLAGLRAERSSLLDRFLALRSQSLVSFAGDYSQWDEMVRFVQNGDTAWAAINIDSSLPNFNAQAAWVARPDGTLLYSARQADKLRNVVPPLGDPAFLQYLRAHRTIRYFQQTPDGLIEVRTGPILPSDDVARQQEARGWFVVARLWDDAQIASLADTLQSRVSLQAPAAAAQPETVRLDRTLRDWRDEPVATLHVEYESQPLHSLVLGNRYEVLLLGAFGLGVIAVTAVGLSLWVVGPVARLQRSLGAGHAEPLGELVRARNEFGELARQVSASFVQRAALRDNERLLRESIELRARLARDLHDGIIQSIYAAGLGLEGLPQLQAADPAAAARRLASCQRLLNDTIWQVRNFITALEPEATERPSAVLSLATLAASMQSVQSVPIAVDVDPALLPRISPVEEMQLLQISRELLSNALRHSQARHVRIALRPQEGSILVLEVADDGLGFDPAAQPEGGRGLRNVAARAAELGAALAIDSAPGKGTRITLRFRIVAPTTG